MNFKDATIVGKTIRTEKTARPEPPTKSRCVFTTLPWAAATDADICSLEQCRNSLCHLCRKAPENARQDDLHLHERIFTQKKYQISTTMQIDKLGTRLKIAEATPPGMTLALSKLLTLKKNCTQHRTCTASIAAEIKKKTCFI